MDHASRAVDVIRRCYPRHLWPGDVRIVACSGGFSGSGVWRLETAEGNYCLRRWPQQHPSAERLQLIHSVLQYAAERGFVRLPVPLRSNMGPTFVEFDGHFWQLEPWISGKADFRDNPSDARLTAAMQVLGEFHRAVADHAAARRRPGASPGLEERVGRLRELQHADGSLLASIVRSRQGTSIFDERAAALVALLPAGIERANSLAPDATLPVPLQPAIRDIWHDHVLFEGAEVTGLIDFGALRIESVSGDIARLLGSLVGDDGHRWRAGLEAYENARSLNEQERRLIPIFDRTAVVLSAVNWLTWIYVEERQFPDSAAVARRLSEVQTRLQALIGG